MSKENGCITCACYTLFLDTDYIMPKECKKLTEIYYLSKLFQNKSHNIENKCTIKYKKEITVVF